MRDARDGSPAVFDVQLYFGEAAGAEGSSAAADSSTLAAAAYDLVRIRNLTALATSTAPAAVLRPPRLAPHDSLEPHSQSDRVKNNSMATPLFCRPVKTRLLAEPYSTTSCGEELRLRSRR